MTAVLLTCRAARLQLQVAGDLSAAHAQALDAHIEQCEECARFRARQMEMDDRILGALGALADTAASHDGVRRIPRASQRGRTARPPARSDRVGRWSMPRWATAVFVAAAVVAALFVPYLPKAGERTIYLRAAYRVMRYNIGFPVAIDRTRPDHLLAGAWGRVYESWNAGGSWHPLSPLGSGLVVRALAVDSSQPTRYLVATRHSIFVSADRGRHWSKSVDSLPGAMNMFLLEDPLAPGTFFLGPSILWKSVDHGSTWTRAGQGAVFAPDGIQALTVAPGGSLITGIWAGGVAISRDMGRTWQRRTRGLRRNVMDVAARSGELWAATDRGLFRSRDAGATWRHVGAGDHFFATSVLAGQRWLLAGGNGALYRSSDGGKRWHLAMLGLPLDPYISSLVADPFRPSRVYASLNMDGLFRSDDGGQHWTPIDAGLQVSGSTVPGHPLLFLRGGALWITDAHGTDPGVLTVDRDVRLAAASPDGAAVAYIAADSSGWAVRALAAGGSAARTLTSGRGSPPRRLIWSPSSSALALVSPAGVAVLDLNRTKPVWTALPRSHLLGWTSDGHFLRFWNEVGGDVFVRSWSAGGPGVKTTEGRYPSLPLPSPDGTNLAYTWQGRLYVGSWGRPASSVASVDRSCRLGSWADDGTRLLIACRDRVEARSVEGRLLETLHGAAPTLWLPGSKTDLLVYREGGLWRWRPGLGTRELVRDAKPALPPQSDG